MLGPTPAEVVVASSKVKASVEAQQDAQPPADQRQPSQTQVEKV